MKKNLEEYINEKLGKLELSQKLEKKSLWTIYWLFLMQQF